MQAPFNKTARTAVASRRRRWWLGRRHLKLKQDDLQDAL
jgi:hypothetical protein